MFRPRPFKVGMMKPPVNNMKFGGMNPNPNVNIPQVYSQVAQASTKARNSIERLKK